MPSFDTLAFGLFALAIVAEVGRLVFWLRHRAAEARAAAAERAPRSGAV